MILGRDFHGKTKYISGYFSQNQAERFTLAVVGPVRSGKSTFIKRFMELLVLPEIKDENERKRTMDELPQSGTRERL